MATQRTARIKPEDVKQPQDHKTEIKDTTVEFNGEEFVIKGKALKDYKILTWLVKVEKEPGYFPLILQRLLGEEQHERFMTIAEDEDGYIDLDVVREFYQNAMEEAGRKNS